MSRKNPSHSVREHDCITGQPRIFSSEASRSNAALLVETHLSEYFIFHCRPIAVVHIFEHKPIYSTAWL